MAMLTLAQGTSPPSGPVMAFWLFLPIFAIALFGSLVLIGSAWAIKAMILPAGRSGRHLKTLLAFNGTAGALLLVGGTLYRNDLPVVWTGLVLGAGGFVFILGIVAYFVALQRRG